MQPDITEICLNCGKCCIGTGIKVYPEDIERWKEQGRLDILLSIFSLLGESRQLIKKKESEECVFFKNNQCLIHDTKPKVCREFPISKKQAEKFSCKAIDMLFPNN